MGRGKASYAYCAGDPVNLVDPDGRKLRITGVQQNTTLELLSELFGSELKLEDDFVTITVEPEKYNKKSKLIAEIINNENIIVELWTTDGKFTEDGTPFCGGIFIGNKTKDFKVYTKQTINLDILFKIDTFGGDRGDSFMHELSESYYGGVYAYNNGIVEVEPAYIKKENEVYKYVHNKAFPTKEVNSKFVNDKGQEVFGGEFYLKQIWYIKYNFREYEIQEVYNRPIIKKKR